MSGHSRRRVYQVYGLRIRSALPLPSLSPAGSGEAETEVVHGSASLFSRIRREIGLAPNGTPWFSHARLPDNSDYLRWAGLFEFLIAPDGGRIACRALDGATPEAFSSYLLSQVLSFALLRRGIEPLHATTVTVDGDAIAFLGDCGYGKSTLGAAFLQAGQRLLTDDQLVLEGKGDQVLAYPGPPRIKLFPETARTLLGEGAGGVPMNHLTPKLVIPLDRRRWCTDPTPLGAIYVIRPPAPGSRSERVTIRPLSARAAFVELLRNTFNPVVMEPERLRRQFHLAARLARAVPVKSLSFPRSLACIPAVRAAIGSDLERSPWGSRSR